MLESIISLAMSLLVAAFAMFVIDNYVSPKRGLRYLMHAAVITGLCAALLRYAGIDWPAFGVLAKVILTTALFGVLIWSVNGQIARRGSINAIANAGMLVAASILLIQMFSF